MLTVYMVQNLINLLLLFQPTNAVTREICYVFTWCTTVITREMLHDIALNPLVLLQENNVFLCKSQTITISIRKKPHVYKI